MVLVLVQCEWTRRGMGHGDGVGVQGMDGVGRWCGDGAFEMVWGCGLGDEWRGRGDGAGNGVGNKGVKCPWSPEIYLGLTFLKSDEKQFLSPLRGHFGQLFLGLDQELRLEVKQSVGLLKSNYTGTP